MKHFLFLFLLTPCSILLAQNDKNGVISGAAQSSRTRVEHTKGAYVDSAKRYYQQASLPLYVYVSHTPTTAPTQLLEQKAKAELKPIYLDGHGEHHLKHFDGVDGGQDVFVVNADGYAPVSTASFLNAPRYNNGKQQFYGKNLKINLRAKDEMSGVSQIYHALKPEFEAYQGTFDLAQEGQHDYEIYSTDKVGNAEKPQRFNFIVDLSAPQTFHHVVGIAKENIISVSTKMYLTFEDNLSGVSKVYYKFDDEAERLYVDGTNLRFDYLSDGEHTLQYYSIDQVTNREEVKSFTFYLDKTAPIMSSDVLGDKFIVGKQVYFSGRTKLKLTAVDNKAGVKEILFAVDDDEFKPYADPFYLPSKSGMHIIQYYALDQMSNEGTGNRLRMTKYDEYRHNVNQVYVDLTGPVMQFEYIGKKFLKGDTIFINSQTKVKLSAQDPESGLQKITFALDKDAEEVNYQRPFTIEQAGTHEVSYFGYDNVNNRNVSRFILVVDNTPPEITTTFSISPTRMEDDKPIYPSYMSVFLASTDTQTGFERFSYTINGGKQLAYDGAIQNFEKNKNYRIVITATDKLGNKSEKEIRFKTDKY